MPWVKHLFADGAYDRLKLMDKASKIRDPKPVGCWCIELPVDPVQRARCRLVADRGTHRLATDYPRQAHIPHQPLDGTSGYGEPFPRHLPPNLAHAVNGEVLGEHARDLRLERQVTSCSRRQAQWIQSLCDMLVIGGWGDRQDIADRLDPMKLTVIIDKRDHRLNGRSLPTRFRRCAASLEGRRRGSSSACAKYADALRKISLA